MCLFSMHLSLHLFILLCFALLCFALHCFTLLCFALLCFALHCFALLCFTLLCFTSLLRLAQDNREAVPGGGSERFRENIVLHCTSWHPTGSYQFCEGSQCWVLLTSSGAPSDAQDPGVRETTCVHTASISMSLRQIQMSRRRSRISRRSRIVTRRRILVREITQEQSARSFGRTTFKPPVTMFCDMESM